MDISKVTIKDLLDSGVHFGHLKRLYNPQNSKNIFGSFHKINIINLDKTLEGLQKAASFLTKSILEDKVVLFVGTKRAAQKSVEEFAEKCGMPYVNYRWLGGMLTNYNTIKQSIKRFHKLQKINDDNTLKSLTKKEGLLLVKEFERLNLYFCGIKNMKNLPDILFIIDVNCEITAVKEANKLGIPVIGIVDTDSKNSDVDYVIPGNDDSITSINLYLDVLTSVILEAKKTKGL